MPSCIRHAVGLRLTILSSLLVLTLASSGSAEIVLGGRDVNGNLDNSGRNLNPAPDGLGQYVGMYGVGGGVAISDKYFLTATHLGVVPTFTLGGTTYNVGFVKSDGDLAVYKILDANKSFSAFIPIYTASNEVGKNLVTIGYGYGRGQALDTPGTMNLAGWNSTGIADGKQSWGTNTVDSVINGAVLDPSLSPLNNYLAFAFNRKLDANGRLLNPDEAIFAGGDSGGATFIKDPVTGQYKLAGINGEVDAVYQKGSTAAKPIYADALFDARGFYSDPNATILITGPAPVPMSSYAIQLSSEQTFLAPFLRTVPEPSSLALLAAGLGLAAFRWRQSRRQDPIPGNARLG